MTNQQKHRFNFVRFFLRVVVDMGLCSNHRYFIAVEKLHTKYFGEFP